MKLQSFSTVRSQVPLVSIFSTMTTMSSFSMSATHHPGTGVAGGSVGMGGSMGPSPTACSLQQRDAVTGSGYSCMTRPPTYDPLTLGAYGTRPSPCSPTQPYQAMNGHQYSANGTSSTGGTLSSTQTDGFRVHLSGRIQKLHNEKSHGDSSLLGCYAVSTGK
jgi:paired box protein 6